jgi:membrane protein involved in colicin uptake
LGGLFGGGSSDPDPVVVPQIPVVEDTAAEIAAKKAAADKAAAEELAAEKAEADKAAQAEAENVRKRKGAASTIKTSGEGILDTANTARKELLG